MELKHEFHWEATNMGLNHQRWDGNTNKKNDFTNVGISWCNKQCGFHAQKKDAQAVPPATEVVDHVERSKHSQGLNGFNFNNKLVWLEIWPTKNDKPRQACIELKNDKELIDGDLTTLAISLVDLWSNIWTTCQPGKRKNTWAWQWLEVTLWCFLVDDKEHYWND